MIVRCTGIALCALFPAFAAPFTITNADLEDKIKGAWLGKTAGVCIGEPTEFNAMGSMVTGSLDLYPDMSCGYNQDDIYVQLTFVEVMDGKMNGAKGIFSATMQDYGDGFAASSYELWHANDVGRNNLRDNILPPWSGMWGATSHQYNSHCEDIDWQIECDWVGLMCPAMPMTALALHDSVGHLMCYANGLYGGYFLGACDALAFQYTDIHTIVKEALKCLPTQCQYYEIINEVITYHDTKPDSTYQACWRYINGKYQKATLTCGEVNPSCGQGCFNIAASLNGAFVAIGLLYGDGDILKSIEYACRCGQDSDCNPSNAGAVVGALLGYNNLPQQWKTSMEANAAGTYASSSYTYPELIQSSIDRAKKTITQMGGSLSGGTWTINAETPQPPAMYEEFGKDPVENTTRATGREGTFRSTGLRRTVQVLRPSLQSPKAVYDIRGCRIRGPADGGAMGVAVIAEQNMPCR